MGLDLKHPEGPAAFLRLVERADVLVENLRPGAMTGLGFGYEALREVNPRLVYASASGWGQDGPLAALPGLDIMAQARGGLMSITGTPDGDPVKVGVPICDLVCAMYVALGVTAALKERDRSRRGPVPGRLAAGERRLVRHLGGRQVLRHRRGRPPARLGAPEHRPLPGRAHRRRPRHGRRRHPQDVEGPVPALGLEELLDDERYADASKRHGAPGHPDPGDRGGHHHPHHRRGRRARSTTAGRALRPDRRLRPGLHRRPPEPARLLLGRAAPHHSGRSGSSARRCGCPGRRPAGLRRPAAGRGTPAPPSSGAEFPAAEIDALIESGGRRPTPGPAHRVPLPQPPPDRPDRRTRTPTDPSRSTTHDHARTRRQRRPDAHRRAAALHPPWRLRHLLHAQPGAPPRGGGDRGAGPAPARRPGQRRHQDRHRAHRARRCSARP